MSFFSVCSRLWRYQSLYFLKPFDAVNDTLTSSLLLKFNWRGKFTEIGCGDGVFNYIMHGGKFPISFDRYLSVNLTKKDIFDTHRSTFKSNKKLHFPKVVLSIDAKESHIVKVKEIGFSENSIRSSYEKLPLADSQCDNIFYYTAHGMLDHESSLKEAFRVLAPGGKLYILLYTEHVQKYFICFRLSKLLPGRVGSYFAQLDNGRANEIGVYSKSTQEWEKLFSRLGLITLSRHQGLSSIAWVAYDIQSRPFLKKMITYFNSYSASYRTILKIILMLITYPLLVVFYLFFSNQYFKLHNDCYIAFELKKTA